MKNIKSNFAEAVRLWRANSPRVGKLSGSFLSIATGTKGVPYHLPYNDNDAESFFQNDATALKFYRTQKERFGVFGHHFIASVPYGLQEWARLGSAIQLYLAQLNKKTGVPSTFHSSGSAEGVIARTVAELGEGKIYTLTNSSTAANEAEFYRRGAVEQARFFAGPYFDIDPELLSSHQNLEPFKEGFDIVYEDTCFQMHAKNRAEQVAWICQNMRDDGLFICLEKCLLEDHVEYQRRENQKDDDFKIRYFSSQQIAEKKTSILQDMQTGQVLMSDLVEGIAATLKHVAVTWNSGNFYTIVASNDPKKVQEFCGYMLPPCIPAHFANTELPRTLHGPDLNLSFRTPQASEFGSAPTTTEESPKEP
jgi:hypothetical protein